MMTSRAVLQKTQWGAEREKALTAGLGLKETKIKSSPVEHTCMTTHKAQEKRLGAHKDTKEGGEGSL